VAQSGGPDRARLEVTLEGPGAESEAARGAAARVVERALGARTDVGPFYRDCAGDPVLAAAIRDFRGLRIAGWPTLWEALVTAILSQQVNLGFAYDIRRELALEFGRSARRGGRIRTAFPEPEALAAETPRRLLRFRLSGAKARAIHGLARAFAGGALSEDAVSRLPDEEAIELLTSFRGVGRWTAEIALLRGLSRTDVFPAGDLGVVKYLAVGLLGKSARAPEEEVRLFAERWRPHRGFALAYAYAELARRQAAEKRSPSAAASPLSRPRPESRRLPGSPRSRRD